MGNGCFSIFKGFYSFLMAEVMAIICLGNIHMFFFVVWKIMWKFCFPVLTVFMMRRNTFFRHHSHSFGDEKKVKFIITIMNNSFSCRHKINFVFRC